MIPALKAEVFEFKAQTHDLLALVIHSLYTNKEIFLRELVSNASDALDRLRFEAMLDPKVALPEGHAPRITLEADPVQRTLTIADNGIGMTREDVIANIGTIARSGTKRLLEQIRARGGESVPELIGRFGVGFYSAFMVASHVTLVTRRVGEETATRWESDGGGEFTVADAERATAGTSVTLTLKPVDSDAGIEAYTDSWVLTRIVKRYSDFIAYPIVLKNAPAAPLDFAATTPPEAPVEDRVLNSRTPVWAQPVASVSEEACAEYYRQLTHDWRPPLLRLSARAEGRIECEALLFIPTEAPPDLYYHAAPYGLQLYAKRVLVMDQCADLLPRHLRFVKGVIDALDLPLHISRQMLQERIQIERIQRWITRKVLDLLAVTRENDPVTYLKFWRQFGRVLKEGLGPDHDNREQLLRLYLFESSHHPTELTTLDEYVKRMRPGQEHIYYLVGESRELIEHAPHVEAVRAREFEVLYLADPVDDLLVQALPEYGGKRLKALDRGGLDLGTDTSTDADPPPAGDFSGLTARLQALMSAQVKTVRLSNRLTQSPACLTGEEYDYSPRTERLLYKGTATPRVRRTLELNARHPLVTRLNERLAAGADDGMTWDDCAELLLGYALLAEGSEPANPVNFGQALARLMQRGL